MYRIPSSPRYFWCIYFTRMLLFTIVLPTNKNNALFWSSFSTFLWKCPHTSAIVVLSYIISVMKMCRRLVLGYGSMRRMIGTCNTQFAAIQ